jgi:hypothetical protein
MRLLEAIHIPLFPDYATAFHKTLAMLRETVDEASFTRAWASGLAADTAHVVADVLAELQSAA